MIRVTLAILLQICSLPFLLVLIVMLWAIHSVESLPVTGHLVPNGRLPVNNAQARDRWEQYEFIPEQNNSPRVPSSIEDPHLFSNYVLSYDKARDSVEKASPDIKAWLGRKFNKFISPQESEKPEPEEIVVPRSSNPNEVFLPIDFNLLVPSTAGEQANASVLSLEENSSLVDEEADEHVLESEPVPSGGRLRAPYDDKPNDFEDFDHNSLDFVQRLIRDDEERPTTTTMAPVATTTGVSGRQATSTLDYRIISYDRPERRLLMTYPIRRLLMAYFAPRILRFQMAMLLNSVIGEVSRKIFDPLISSRFGFGGATQATTLSPTSSSTPLSLAHLANSLHSLSSLPNLASLASHGLLPPPAPKVSAPLPASPQVTHTYPETSPNSAPVAAASSSANPLSSILSSALSGLPGGLNLSPQNIQSLISSLSDSDVKQIMALTGQATGNYQSNVDYDDESRQTETSAADLTPT